MGEAGAGEVGVRSAMTLPNKVCISIKMSALVRESGELGVFKRSNCWSISLMSASVATSSATRILLSQSPLDVA